LRTSLENAEVDSHAELQTL